MIVVDGIALALNAARERPEDALRIMSSAIDGAISIIGTRDDAATSARRLIGMVEELEQRPKGLPMWHDRAMLWPCPVPIRSTSVNG